MNSQHKVNNNKERIEQNKEYYRRRQAIVEHPYGTIKRQWGFSYILTKKYMQRAGADVGLMFVAYNLRRLINILGKNVVKEYFRTFACSPLLLFDQIRAVLSRFKAIVSASGFYPPFFEHPANQLIFTQKSSVAAGF